MKNIKLTLAAILMATCFTTGANADVSSDTPSWWNYKQAAAMYLKSINHSQEPKSFAAKWKVLGRVERRKKELSFGFGAYVFTDAFRNSITYDETWLRLSDERNSIFIEVGETEVQSAYNCKAKVSVMADLEAPFVPGTFWDISETVKCDFDNSGMYIEFPGQYYHVSKYPGEMHSSLSCRKTYRDDQLICHYLAEGFGYSDYLLLQKMP